jgi:hypothetical protein
MSGERKEEIPPWALAEAKRAILKHVERVMGDG